LCDNLVTCVCRAWDIGEKPFLVAPAMNTLMWKHPFTERQLNILRDELDVVVIDPISKLLACGDQGMGAMSSVDTIIETILAYNTKQPQP
jgi:phosphopantothenoylcysteine decarboxylase